jgi:hypothetical protein
MNARILEQWQARLKSKIWHKKIQKVWDKLREMLLNLFKD